MRAALWGLFGVGAATALLVGACGGKPIIESLSERTVDGGNGSGGAPPDSGSGTGSVLATGSTPVGGCTPKTCVELGKNCGTSPDTCGGVVECGACSGTEVCGSTQPNVCGDPGGTCTPLDRATACAGKACGLEGDGCSGVIDCGSCPTGETCGIVTAFQCDTGTAAGDGGNCPSRITTCASAGKVCGIIGDGCGGVIDCNAETGGCAPGTYCGIVSPSQCDPPPPCVPAATSCAALGWECGTAIDNCGNQYSCAAEGRTCGPLELCMGGIGAPTQCTSTVADCPLCASVPDCSGAAGPTRLRGRVITPGRTNANTGNQVGVPNAFVYILRANDPSTLPAILTGLPSDGTTQRCDRCEENVLGPVLAGAVTDAHGEFVIEGNIPVGVEFVLVVKVGKFRRAVRHTLAADRACLETALPTAAAQNPTRLPRTLSDGLAVNIPRVAISTGDYDAMECVFEKMGLAHSLFTRPQLSGRIHLYRDNGAWPDAQSQACNGCGDSTCRTANCGGSTTTDRTSFLDALNASRLHENGGSMSGYDMVVSDCRGNDTGAPSSGSAGAQNVRTYVNRGGRVFASHYSHNWIQDGSAAYSAASPLATGLAPAVTWQAHDSGIVNGTGIISVNPPRTSASPRIQTFIDWMVRENAVASATNLTFNIPEPRSRATTLGPYTEEFVHCDGGVCDRASRRRPQQVAFNTPYAAPAADAACGRVVYSGFHVSATGAGNQAFPDHCTGDLTPTEKTLLFLLFDLGACVGEPPTPPTCTPDTVCPANTCGLQPDGCGGSKDCGPCIPTCTPLTCTTENAECGLIGDGCGGTEDCGPCPPGQVCGAQAPNRCGTGTCTPRGCPADAECGQTGNGCGGLVSCGTCPPGQICGIDEPFKCGPPPGCTQVKCADVGAECGVISDGCGSVVDCGECPSGFTCGLREANRCSSIQ